MEATEQVLAFEPSRTLYDEADTHQAKLIAPPGLNEEVVRLISKTKNEPEWMLQKRLKGLKLFFEKPLPDWGPSLKEIDFDQITYFVDPNAKESTKWEDVPAEIRRTFDRLGIPEAEKKSLAGAGAQFDSGMVYHNLMEDLKKKGVIFENMDVAVHKYPDLVKQHFMTSCIPVNDHKFIMLHAAVWSAGTFIYIPKGVKVELPLQAYFRMNEQSGGQFEHTLIIVDEGAELHYVEGCSSPRYSTTSIHAGAVEIFVKEGAKMHYSSIENWSRNVYNCLSGDTRIYTVNKGLIELKNISIGDIVFALDIEDMKIKEKRILQKWAKGKEKVYKIKLSNGSEIKATAEHPFLSFDKKNRKTDWRTVQSLVPGDLAWVPKEIAVNQEVTFKIKVEKPKTNKYTYIRYPSTAVPEVMWLLGLYVGDGSRQFSKERRKYTAVVYSVPISESIHTKLKVIAKKYFGVEPTVRKDGVASTFSSVHFSKFIETVGLEGKASSKRIPSWVYKTSRENRLSFLAGIIDSDGHITKNGYVAQVINCNRNLLEDIRYLALSVGMGASAIIERDYPSTRKELFIKGVPTCASESYILKLSNIQNLRPYLKKKESQEKIKILKSKNKLIKANNYNIFQKLKLNLEQVGIVSIVSIEEKGTEEVYDLEVEGLHNFVANGIIVKNCNTKRALVDKDATMIWVSGNMGSKVSMLYPCSVLRGSGAKSDSLGIAFAGEGQHQDVGAKAIHVAPNTSSTIHSKSISKNGGVSSYRGLVKIMPNARGSKTSVVCDALILDERSISNTYPHLKIDNHDVDAAHEARVGKINEETIFYLQSRGLSEEDAVRMIVSGFISPIIRQLPLEYAVELNKLIEMEIEGF